MDSFKYVNHVEVLFGAGSRKQIIDLIQDHYSKVLFLCAKGPFRDNGLFDEISSLIKAGGAEVFEMNDIDQNPRLSSARVGMEICANNAIDCVVALGGGSAMDCAKLIAASGKTGIDPYEYVFGDRPAVTDSIDTIMIPTISATGTECNPSAVIVNDETKEKYYCDCFFAKYAILDPEITVSVPLKLAIWGAMDILSHTFEYYFNGFGSAWFQTEFSEAIIRSTMKAVEKMVEDPSDLNARGELMWDAIMAWGGLTKIGRGNPDMTCHSIEESFSGWFDTHHGACLGILTPRWMDIVCKKRPDVFARFAREVMRVNNDNDEEAAVEGVRAYKNWLISVGAPNVYSDIGNRDFDEENLRHVADTALRIYHGEIGRLYRFTPEEIMDLLRAGNVAYVKA